MDFHLYFIEELRDCLDDFDRRLAAVAQSAVELEIGEDDMDTDIDVAADFRAKAKRSRQATAQLLRNRQGKTNNGTKCSFICSGAFCDATKTAASSLRW